MLQGDKFDETIAHEVAHHVQFIVSKRFGWKTPFHGELWRTVMASTGFKARPKAKPHGFPKATVKAVAQLARIQLKGGAA
jgi:predicted SprT family Zn-dependent metalloprotease